MARPTQDLGPSSSQNAHAALDTAVLTAYGLSAKKDLLAQLLALYQEVTAKIEKGESVTAPGVPNNSPDAKKLETRTFGLVLGSSNLHPRA